MISQKSGQFLFLNVQAVPNGGLPQGVGVHVYLGTWPFLFHTQVCCPALCLMQTSAVDMVELAKIMETVLDVVKRHSSHSSETFWRDVGDIGTMLFGER